MDRVRWKQKCKGVLLIAAAILLIRLLLPFALAWGLIFLLRPAICRLSALTGRSEKTVGILLLTLTLTLGSGLLVWLGARLLTELPRLLCGLSHTAEELSGKLRQLADQIAGRLPIAEVISGKERSRLVGELLKSGVAKLSATVTAWAGKGLLRFPGGLVNLVVFWMAAYYLVADYRRINRYFASLLPSNTPKTLQRIGHRLRLAVSSYLRAYLLLFAVTFSVLLAAFFCMGIRYGITLALVAALLDALPAVGVGIVLLPWSVAELAVGNFSKGIALPLIWLGVTLLRQLLEPRIVGAKLGLHPVAALAAAWVGFRLAGVWGVFLAPPGAILLRSLLEGYRQI